MQKTIFSMLAAALVCVAGTSALADQSISSSTLDAMGLSGLVVMTDSDAMSVRGMGYSGNRNSDHGNDYHSKKGKKSSAKASGRSWANVEYEGEKVDVEADAGSRNSYAAEGKYRASGDNGSEAELEKSWTTRMEFGHDDYTIETKTFKIEVEAGGWSSAKAY